MKLTEYVIDSKQRKIGTTGKFAFDFRTRNESLDECYLEFFRTFNMQYNINQYNNSFTMTYSSVGYNITLTPGYYSSGTQLAAELKTELDSCGSGLIFTVAYSTINSIITISTTQVVVLTIPQTGINRLIGFNLTNYTGLSTYTGDSQTNLIYTDYLMLQLPQLNIITAIPMNATSTGMLFYQNSFNNLMRSKAFNVSYTDVILQDQYGNDWTTDFVMQLGMK